MSDPLPMVYVGPSSKKLGLEKYHVYAQTSEQVAQAMKDNPAMKMLFMSLETFNQKKHEVIGGTHAGTKHAVEQLITDKVL